MKASDINKNYIVERTSYTSSADFGANGYTTIFRVGGYKNAKVYLDMLEVDGEARYGNANRISRNVLEIQRDGRIFRFIINPEKPKYV